MDKFIQCYPFTKFHEGGEVDSDIDRGGHTWYGISQFWKSKYPDFFENPTPEFAERILRTEFWRPYLLEQLPPYIAVIAFDCFVNHRPDDAAKVLQRGAGRLLVDGVMGKKTRERLCEPDVSIPRILQWRLWLYDQIIENDPEQQGNKDGWVWRTNCLNRYSLGLEVGINIHPDGRLLP